MGIEFIEAPWRRLQHLAGQHKALVAVPFLGKDAARLLPLQKGSVLVTRMNEAAVKQGLVDPREVAKLMARGVEVHNSAALHAKVYIFGSRALIGSANVSNNSAKHMIEVCVETSDRSVVASARAFVAKLAADAVGIEWVKQLFDLYPGDRVGGGRVNSGAGGRRPSSDMWVLPTFDVDRSAEAIEAENSGRRIARKQLADASSSMLDTFDWKGSGWKAVTVGDRVVCRWGNSPRFEFESPARILHIEQYDGGAVLLLERRRGLRTRTTTQVRRGVAEGADAFLFKGDNPRRVRSTEVAATFSRLWVSL